MLRPLIILLLITTASCSSMNEAQRASKSDLHTRIGTGLLKNNRLPQAMSELLTAIDLDPKNHVAHNNLALVYLLRDRAEIAEKHLRISLKLAPNYTDAKNNLGRVLIQRRQIRKAISVLEEAREDLTYPTPGKILTNLGWAYYEGGQFLKSQGILQQAIELNRKDCFSTNLWAKTFYRLEQYEPAAMGFDKAIEVCRSKKFGEPQYFAGLSYLKVGRNQVAKTRFQELLSNYPAGKFHGKATKILAKQWPNSKKKRP